MRKYASKTNDVNEARNRLFCACSLPCRNVDAFILIPGAYTTRPNMNVGLSNRIAGAGHIRGKLVDLQDRITIGISDPWEFHDTYSLDSFEGKVVLMEPNAFLVEIVDVDVISRLKSSHAVCGFRYEGERYEGVGSASVPVGITFVDREHASEMIDSMKIDLSWWRGGGAAIGSVST